MPDQTKINTVLIYGHQQSGKKSLRQTLVSGDNHQYFDYLICNQLIKKPKKIILLVDSTDDQSKEKVIGVINHILQDLHTQHLHTPILVLINKVDQIIQTVLDSNRPLTWTKNQFTKPDNSLMELTTLIYSYYDWKSVIDYFESNKQVKFRLFMTNPNQNLLYEAQAKGLLYPIMDYEELEQWIKNENPWKPQLIVQNETQSLCEAYSVRRTIWTGNA